MIRHGVVELTPEEAERYTEDERANLRSWGLGVPEPAPIPPDPDEPPLTPLIYHTPNILRPLYKQPVRSTMYVMPMTMSAAQISQIPPIQWQYPAAGLTAYPQNSGSYIFSAAPGTNPMDPDWRIK